MAEQERRDTVPGGPDGGARDRVGDRDGQGAAADRLEADTAQLLEANRRLREAIQRRDELLALAAEDLRGPAAAVLRQLQRLREDVLRAPAADCQRALDALDRQARRVVSLADDLLVLRTIEGGQAQLHRRPVELGALVVGVVASRLPAFEAAGVELDRELPPYPLSLHADPDRLAEALGALLDAALGASTRGEMVRLTVEASPEGARVTVDDGRATLAAGPRAPRGTGRRGGEGRLALAVCRRLAELHGGSLEIVPRGRGRTARLTLPAAGPADERAPARPHPSGARARLLVADDDGDAREALAMLLGDDYEVQLAADGQEAVESALVTRPDLVLLDLYMPRLDGLAALEALRADPLTADVPVILVSARGDELTRSRSLDLGAVDFLQKPFSGRELKARIERTLRLTRRETQLQELARTDPLTGLANLRAFRGRLEEEVKRARRYRTPLACVMVDMDHLKPINDELGHAAGDLALGALAEVIRRELRETDFGARYGGDEFVMLLPHTSADEARVLTERICARLREASPEVAGRRLALAASFGIAALGDEPIDELGETLVRRADAALYAAKRAGRGQVAAHPTPGGESAPAP